MVECVNMAGEGRTLYPLRARKSATGSERLMRSARARRRDSIEPASPTVNTAVSGRRGESRRLPRSAIACRDVPNRSTTTEMPAMFVPFQELEITPPATWYVNVLAKLRKSAARASASALLALAERIAADAGLARPEHHRQRRQRGEPARSMDVAAIGEVARRGDGQGRLGSNRGRRMGLLVKQLSSAASPRSFTLYCPGLRVLRQRLGRAAARLVELAADARHLALHRLPGVPAADDEQLRR